MPKSLTHKLKNRHIQMIALGGIIGTGLFFGSASSIQATGPSIILAYLLGGIVIYIIMRALGEMTVHEPSAGSFSHYANNYLGKYAGFISGWTAWFQYTVVCMVELTAVTVFLDYFIPGLPHWLVCLTLLCIFTLIQLVSVRLFGEFEFWFAGIKIAVIILMLILSVYLVVFNTNEHHTLLNNLTSYSDMNIFFNGGYKGFLFALVLVTFSFGGSEFVSIAAAEAENPQKSIPHAIKGVIIRIILFYVLTILAIICLYPFNKLDSHISPFVDVFEKTGLHHAAIIMDIVAITAALSAFNSCLYAASRMLYGLSSQQSAPKKFNKLSNNHIPYIALIFTSICIVIGVIINYIFPEHAIMYLLTIATGSILTCWIIILLTQISFRAQKTTSQLKYTLIGYPYTSWFAIICLLIVIIIMFWMPDMRMSIMTTPIWIAFLSIIYYINKTLKN